MVQIRLWIVELIIIAMVLVVMGMAIVPDVAQAG